MDCIENTKKQLWYLVTIYKSRFSSNLEAMIGKRLCISLLCTTKQPTA